MRRRQPRRKTSPIPSAATDDVTRFTSLEKSHVSEAEAHRPLCRFYVLHKGHCRHGLDCTYSHVIPEGMSWEEAKQLVPCPFFGRGNCRYGDFCQLRHDTQDLVTYCKECAVASPSVEDATAAATTSSAHDAKDETVICGICLEEFTNHDTNKNKRNRRFGLLSCCNHAFCFDCLMEWRKEGSQDASDRRSCPTCRKHSDYVVPSPTFPSSTEQKESFVQEYKDKLAVIPCRRFQETYRLGSCPFGSDCFYAHLDASGNDVKALDQSMEELFRERERIQESRRRRRQRDARMSFLGVVESNMDDIDVLMSFFRLLHVYGYQGAHELHRSDDDEVFDNGDMGNNAHHYRNDGLADSDFENVD